MKSTGPASTFHSQYVPCLTPLIPCLLKQSLYLSFKPTSLFLKAEFACHSQSAQLAPQLELQSSPGITELRKVCLLGPMAIPGMAPYKQAAQSTPQPSHQQQLPTLPKEISEPGSLSHRKKYLVMRPGSKSILPSIFLVIMQFFLQECFITTQNPAICMASKLLELLFFHLKRKS